MLALAQQPPGLPNLPYLAAMWGLEQLLHRLSWMSPDRYDLAQALRIQSMLRVDLIQALFRTSQHLLTWEQQRFAGIISGHRRLTRQEQIHPDKHPLPMTRQIQTFPNQQCLLIPQLPMPMIRFWVLVLPA